MNFGTHGFPQGLGLNSDLFGLSSTKNLWSPSNITTELWLDGADNSTITLVSSAISQWDDKSGNSRNASQSNSSLRPQYTVNALNGKNVVTFDGVNDTLNTASFSFSTQNLATCCVFRTSSINEKGVWGGIGSSRVGLFFTGANLLRSMLFDTVSVETSGFSTGSYTIVSTNRVTNNIQQHWDGNLVGSTSVAPASIVPLSISVGSWADNMVPSLSGEIAELVVFNNSVDNRQRTEGYLAHKWGLGANLPSTHPYKVYPPYI